MERISSGVIYIPKTQLYVAEAAELLGCSSMKVYGLIRSGKLKAHKEGKAWKIRVFDLNDYLHSLTSCKE